MGTTGLVLGIVALALSWVPILGILCFPLGLLGVVFGCIGMVRAGRGLADNTSSALAGVVTSVLAIVVRLAIYTATAVSQVAAGPIMPVMPTVPTRPPPPEPVVLQIGEAADVNGLVVTARALETQRLSPIWGGTPLLCSKVRLANNSSEEKDILGPYEWRIQDPRNVQHSDSPVADDRLPNATLAPGGEVTGTICIDDPGLPGPYVVIYDGFGSDSAPVRWTTSW
jgi:hypothetical protein